MIVRFQFLLSIQGVERGYRDVNVNRQLNLQIKCFAMLKIYIYLVTFRLGGPTKGGGAKPYLYC